MTELTITILDSIYNSMQALANKENIAIDQFIALGEKMSALITGDYLVQRAKRGRRDKFLAVLDAASEVEPVEDNKIN